MIEVNICLVCVFGKLTAFRLFNIKHGLITIKSFKKKITVLVV